ncbi:MAG: hypothetical protein LQ340_005408 [Diploschistes diacapsis]|nr:MAG: hypothetical protein LQ340_005408 [Diploschistes diacapsis]
MATDLERQEQIKNDGEQVKHETVHIIGASVQKHQQIDVPTGISTGVDFDNKNQYLRERTREAIFKYRDDRGLTFRNQDRLRQDIKPIDEFPNGYPKLAAVESCDDNFLIYKKFKLVRNRVLLALQDEILVLQDDLTNLDDHHKKSDPARLYSRRRDDNVSTKRRDLLAKGEKLLLRYDKLLQGIYQMGQLEIPSERNQRSLHNIIHNGGLQTQSESEWITDRYDLAALAPNQERSSLNAFVEEFPKRVVSRSFAARLFRTEDQRRRTGGEDINLYSRDRIDAVTNALVTFIATLLLLVPIGILYLTNAQPILQLVVILCFTQLFGICIATLTKARKQDVFSATAAYTAVLVVFLANSTSFVP